MIRIGSINIEIPGGQMYSNEEVELDKTKLKKESMWLNWEEKIKQKNGKFKKERVKERVFYTVRKCNPATMVVPIYDIAYEAWISNEVPAFSTIKDWKKKTTEERLIAHLERIADNYNGKLIDWHINLD